MTFINFLVLSNQLKRILDTMALAVIALCVLIYAPVLMATISIGSSFVCSVFLVQAFRQYRALAWPTIEIYNKIVESADLIEIDDDIELGRTYAKLTIGDNTILYDIESKRIVNDGIEGFTDVEHNILSAPFAKAVNVHAETKYNEYKNKQQPEAKEKFAALFNMTKDSDEKNKL